MRVPGKVGKTQPAGQVATQIALVSVALVAAGASPLFSLPLIPLAWFERRAALGDRGFALSFLAWVAVVVVLLAAYLRGPYWESLSGYTGSYPHGLPVRSGYDPERVGNFALATEAALQELDEISHPWGPPKVYTRPHLAPLLLVGALAYCLAHAARRRRLTLALVASLGTAFSFAWLGTRRWVSDSVWHGLGRLIQPEYALAALCLAVVLLVLGGLAEILCWVAGWSTGRSSAPHSLIAPPVTTQNPTQHGASHSTRHGCIHSKPGCCVPARNPELEVGSGSQGVKTRKEHYSKEEGQQPECEAAHECSF